MEPEHGEAIGLLHQSWHRRVEREENESAQQRLERWRESDIWADTIRAVGAAPSGCRLVRVMDSHGDCFTTFSAAREMGVDLLVRVMHYDRKRIDGVERVEHLERQPVLGTVQMTLHTQRDERNRVKHAGREVKLEARVSRVTVPPPSRGDVADEAAITLNAILLREIDPPAGDEPVRWVLLSTLAVESMEQVSAVARYYALRWRIEEFHRVEKEGCKIEDAQFDDASDLMRLAAIRSIIAVRLLQLRDAAAAALLEPAKLDTPKRLAQIAPASWIAVVATLAEIDPSKLTVSQFYRRIAMRGGWLGRKHDGHPGWKTLWRGWSELWWVVMGYELAGKTRKRSG